MSVIQFTQSKYRKLVQASTHLIAIMQNDPTLIQADKTPYEVIFTHDIVQLRYYPVLTEHKIDVNGTTVNVEQHRHRTPLVIVPPLAVNMLIYDLFPERSLVKFLRAKGFEVYLIDWGRPQRSRHNEFNFGTYITEFMPTLLKQVRQHSDQLQLTLHGWSLGGVISYCYLAWSGDKNVKNLVLTGVPCNYHKNGELGELMKKMYALQEWVHQKLHLRPNHFPLYLWHIPGWANSLGFKMLNPGSAIKSYIELARKLNDREFIINYKTNSAFLDDMVAYPGGIILDLIQLLWGKNILSEQNLPINNCNIKLEKLPCNTLMFVGQQDSLVTLACTRPIFNFIDSHADQCLFEVPGGHMSIISGRQAPQYIWLPLVEWLTSRSV